MVSRDAARELGTAANHLVLVLGTRIPLEFEIDLRCDAVLVGLDDLPAHDLADRLESPLLASAADQQRHGEGAHSEARFPNISHERNLPRRSRELYDLSRVGSAVARKGNRMNVAKGFRIRIDYEIKLKDGDVIESSAKTGPLEYVHGDGRMLPGLEKRLEGAKAGVEVKGEIPATEAFGGEDVFPTKVIAKAEFPKGVDLAVGSTFEAKTGTGETVIFKLIEVTAEGATARLLPVIAGKDLVFRVKVLMIEDPATGTKEIVDRKPPPPPAGALKLDVEDDAE